MLSIVHLNKSDTPIPADITSNFYLQYGHKRKELIKELTKIRDLRRILTED